MSIKVNHNINLLTSNSKADKTNNLLSQFVVKFLQLAPANEADKIKTFVNIAPNLVVVFVYIGTVMVDILMLSIPEQTKLYST